MFFFSFGFKITVKAEGKLTASEIPLKMDGNLKYSLTKTPWWILDIQIYIKIHRMKTFRRHQSQPMLRIIKILISLRESVQFPQTFYNLNIVLVEKFNSVRFSRFIKIYANIWSNITFCCIKKTNKNKKPICAKFQLVPILPSI